MEDCVFCKIVRGEIPCTKVYEDDAMLAFKDIEPQAPIHFLIIPKKHIKDLLSLSEEDCDLMAKVQQVVKKLALQEGLDEKGFRLVTNCGKAAGQSVFHLHFHLMGGRNFTWPAG
ncbi:MAG: histidine triad nucleotide-binding protein [bacterium]